MYYQHDLKEKNAWTIIENKKTGKSISKNLTTLFDINKKGRDSISVTKIRLGQSYFRKMVLQNYNNRCCVTGLNIPQILHASHIVPWSSDKSNRMNPENGLCLSATYDAAFDKHLISFDDDYRLILSNEIKDYYENDVVKAYFKNFEGKQIILPTLFFPNKKLLQKHRELMT